MEIVEELHAFADFNPPLRIPLNPPCFKLGRPRWFYDKHLDEKLCLNDVKIIPLASYLSRVLNLTIESLQAQRKSLPMKQSGDSFPSEEIRNGLESTTEIGSGDVSNIARKYQTTTSLYCRVIASSLVLHPSVPGWFSSLIWKKLGRFRSDSLAFSEDFGLIFDNSPPKAVKTVIDKDPGIRELLQQVIHRHPILAYWDVFSWGEEAEGILKNMDQIVLPGRFRPERCCTLGYRSPPDIAFSQFDATKVAWEIPISKPMNNGFGRKEKIIAGHSPLKVSWPDIVIPPPLPVRPVAERFLLRSWARSVEYDTTFIIFHCGNFERIGFRHRRSQTLFLSELLDIPNCENPAYGGIHAGLYVSILQDVMDRTSQEQIAEEAIRTRTKKRKREVQDEGFNRRYKTRAVVTKHRQETEYRRVNEEGVKKYATRCSLALLEIRYGPYNSPAPAALVRSGTKQKKVYKHDEYLLLTLTSKIAEGATGVAHIARLEILVNECTYSAKVVVKIAFSKKQVKRLRHEHSVYAHLASRGVVEGIPFLFGMFEDVEMNAVALVMSHVGECLLTARPDPADWEKVLVSEIVKASYHRILTTIHQAGVRHRDIRSENLTIADNDEVAFIDFDRAELDPSETDKQREVEALNDFLNGGYGDEGSYVSSGSSSDPET
ncbi:hypothetical protein C0995_009796 [Termitomyces sp. Mi166|nr:hypothetical protein C0995_009796 [Termitomyces sp. Mi166\